MTFVLAEIKVPSGNKNNQHKAKSAVGKNLLYGSVLVVSNRKFSQSCIQVSQLWSNDNCASGGQRVRVKDSQG